MTENIKIDPAAKAEMSTGQRTVFITGATSGFGEACATIFAKNGYRLVLNGRRQERLQAISTRLQNDFDATCYCLPFDVQDRNAVLAAVDSLPPDWQNIDVLINNAGLALGRDLFDQANPDDWDTMIDTNLKGLLYVSKAVVPLMIKRRQGHIINVGSTAAKDVYEGGSVYCASKAAVDTVSKAMRLDLLPHHIKVTAIHPGAAETEFSQVRFKGDEAAAARVYEGYQPLTAGDVAGIIYYCATLPSHVCINDLVVTCTQQANGLHIVKDGKMD